MLPSFALKNANLRKAPSLKDRIGSYRDNLAADSATIAPSSDTLDLSEEVDKAPSLNQRIGCYKQNLEADASPNVPTSDVTEEPTVSVERSPSIFNKSL